MPQPKPQPPSLQDICDQLRNQVEEVAGKNLQFQAVFAAFSGRIFGTLLLACQLQQVTVVTYRATCKILLEHDAKSHFAWQTARLTLIDRSRKEA